MPRPNKALKVKVVNARIEGVAAHDLIPMPHDGALDGKAGAVGYEGRYEYQERLQRYREVEPGYLDRFARPPSSAIEEAWEIVQRALKTTEAQKAAASAIFYPKDKRPDGPRRVEAKGAFLALLSLLVGEDSEPQSVTFNDAFDTVCRKYSDNYIHSPAYWARDMTPLRVKRAHRDLLMQFIDVSKLWRFLLKWPKSFGCQIYAIDTKKVTLEGFGDVKYRTRHVAIAIDCLETMELRRWFLRYDLKRPRGIRLKFPKVQESEGSGDESVRALPVAFERLPLDSIGPLALRPNSEFCTEAPFNEIKLSARAERVLDLQGKAQLIFERLAFESDYKDVVSRRKRLRDELDKERVDWRLPSSPRQKQKASDAKSNSPNFWSSSQKFWSVRDAEVYYRSIEHAIESATPPTPEAVAVATDKFGRKPEVCKARRDGFLSWLERRVKKGAAKEETLGAAKTKSVMDLTVAAVSALEWRERIKEELASQDRANDFVRTYRATMNQLKPVTHSSPLRINSEFYRAVNRRYHPTAMWPTYVSNKERTVDGGDAEEGNAEGRIDADLVASLDDEDEDQDQKSYRRRWFKARHPISGERCELVGIDVSSSQTQIVATFLGSAALEQDTMRTGRSVAFKETLAQIAFDKHCAPKDKDPFSFRTRTALKDNDPDLREYSGSKDPRLQNLCKSLWMTVSYGGTIQGAVEAQQYDKANYGLGWTAENASLFLQSINERYPSMTGFLSACRYIAGLIAEGDPADGFVMSDPFDGSVIRWNPVARQDSVVDVGSGKLILSLPRNRDKKDVFVPDAQYPVDAGSLRRMFAPCLVHTLDAYYSALVMERLADRGITDFVAIHDCWLIPEWVSDRNQTRRGMDVIEEVFKDLASEWYNGIGPVYEAP